MSFREELDGAMQAAEAAASSAPEMFKRLKAEVDFAADLANAHPRRKAPWRKCILEAVASFTETASAGAPVPEAVERAEAILSPLAKAAKRYTIHCVGHAHIDMNWMWGWPETVAVVNDTFTTVDRLMDVFPTFKFSQSQVSVYEIMRDYLPELYERVKERIAEGRWEVTASQWVECDKNLPSGEALCRHPLYAKRFLNEELGLGPDAVKIDWECDVFGHARTVPTILAQAGVRWYYFHRAGPGPWLFWWRGPDGARVLAFDDAKRGYNGRIDEQVARYLFEYEAQTGLKDFLFVYGVGDHGGGPTRRDLTNAVEMDAWPVFPNIKLSTVEAWFRLAERNAKDLPVVDDEMNFVFEGCYTSQSEIKHANRTSENALVEAEMFALLARGLVDMPYPADALQVAWRHACFNQFHDILPGSNTADSRHHALGLFQEVLARTSMVKTRALRKLAARVNTAEGCRCEEAPADGSAAVGSGIGAGAGNLPRDGMPTHYATGGVCCEPFVVFNPSPWTRTEVVTARVWDREWPDGEIVVRDDSGETLPAQVIDRGAYWGSDYVELAFPARDVAGLGWRAYSVARSAEPPEVEAGVAADAAGRIENAFFRVEVEPASGAVTHLIDKRSNVDFVGEGGRMGFLEYLLEAPHGMTAWVLAQIVRTTALLEGGEMDCPQAGPHRASLRTRHKMNDSAFALTVSVAAGVPRVDFELEVDWLERGSREIGVPMLRAVFPVAVESPVATFECPNGHVERSTDPRELGTHSTDYLGVYMPQDMPIDRAPGEVPAQKWADLTGRTGGRRDPVGVTLLNDSKYGHNVNGSRLALTLLRSTSDPDPLPELGRHVIRFALRPHVGVWTASDATRAGYEFNLPLNVVGATKQAGTLPARKGFAEILTPGIMLSGMKRAEDSDALVVRLYEMEGKRTTARIRLDEALAAPAAAALETDLLERPVDKSTARMDEGVLSVEVPAFGLVTVKIG